MEKKKKLCLCHFGGANQSSPLQLPELIWRWTVSQKRKRGERRESERKTEGKAQRKRGNPPFFCSPGWSLHPGPQRGTEYTSSPQWGNHRGCCSQCVCVSVRACVHVQWGCSFKQAFEWPNCTGIQQSENWLRTRRAAGGVSARTSTATLSKRAKAQCTQLMRSLSLTLSPLFVLSRFYLILLLLTPYLALPSLSFASLTPPHTYTTLPPSFPTQYAVTYSSTVLILPYSPSISHSLMRTTITVRMKGAGRPPLCKAWNEPWWELFISEQLIWNKISIWHLCCSIFLRLIWALFKKSVMCVVCRYSDRPDSDCRIHLWVSPWKQDLIHFQDNILNNQGLLDKLAENLMWLKKRTQKCH